MGPKKKGVKKKVGKKSGSTKGPTIIDGVPVSEMTKDQLEGHVRRLQDELHREREERNYYQLERDRLTTFWEVGRRQLGECRAEARVKDRELEEAEERHQAEIKVYKQKVKHLLYEQEQNLAELRAENMVSLKVVTEEHQKVELQHLVDKRHLQEQLHAKDKQYTEILRDIKLKQSEEIERLRHDFEERVREIERRYSARFATLRSELQLRLKSEVSETEERKNAQISNIRKRNEKAVTDMRNYYNDITLNNLAMISTLKEEIKSKEERLERSEQLLGSVQQENRRLADPLKKAKEQLQELQRQLGTQEKEKGALSAARAELKAAKKEVEELRWELEVLQQKHDRAVSERDDLHDKFSRSVLDLQEKSSLKYAVLERQIAAVRKELDVRDAQLHAVVVEDGGDKAGDKDRRTYLLDSVRDVVEEQAAHIRRLERNLLIMRQRRQWGDDGDEDDEDGRVGEALPEVQQQQRRTDSLGEVRGVTKTIGSRQASQQQRRKSSATTSSGSASSASSASATSSEVSSVSYSESVDEAATPGNGRH